MSGMFLRGGPLSGTTVDHDTIGTRPWTLTFAGKTLGQYVPIRRMGSGQFQAEWHAARPEGPPSTAPRTPAHEDT